MFYSIKNLSFLNFYLLYKNLFKYIYFDKILDSNKFIFRIIDYTGFVFLQFFFEI